MTDAQPNTLTNRLDEKIAQGMTEERELLKSLRDLLIKQDFRNLAEQQAGEEQHREARTHEHGADESRVQPGAWRAGRRRRG